MERIPLIKGLLDFLTEAVRVIPHPVLQFAVVAQALLSFLFLMALLLGVPLCQLTWFSIPLTILYITTLAFVYARGRGEHMTLEEVRQEKKVLEDQKQTQEEEKALFARF